ncbi:hypothetical protein Salat_2679200 [Sesamum alatum]|uniref:Uncharacterized protein n=1 Tax=Sesamum alatum TaxID=300844 RepID=A0AAE1XPK6_9LAMI|nr:hypothetical protein Salat_2679200 [Sesamum alatum]
MLAPTAHTRVEEHHAHAPTQKKKIKPLEAKLEDQAFRSQVELETTRTVAMESGKTEGFLAGWAVGKEECLIAGCGAYLSSMEHQMFILDTRLQGARGFLKFPAFKVAIEVKAVDYLDEGFERCQPQVQKLKGFTEGFDLSWLDPTLDRNLAAFPEEEAPPIEIDEFQSLVEEVEKMDFSS